MGLPIRISQRMITRMETATRIPMTTIILLQSIKLFFGLVAAMIVVMGCINAAGSSESYNRRRFACNWLFPIVGNTLLIILPFSPSSVPNKFMSGNSLKLPDMNYLENDGEYGLIVGLLA